MKYNRFEELPVWKASIDLAQRVYKLTSDHSFRGQGSLRDQIERAAVSISNNIAEGFERGTKQELLSFLYIARGSAGEVRSMLCLLGGLAGFENFKFEISDLKLLAEEIGSQLRGWADFLQESPIKGQKFLANKSRRLEQARKDREDMIQELRRIQGGAQR